MPVYTHLEENKAETVMTVMVPVLLRGCEIWKMNKLVDMFQCKCLHGILRVHWSKHTCIWTEDLLEWAQMKSLSEEVKARRCKMIGDILIQDQKNDGNVAMT